MAAKNKQSTLQSGEKNQFHSNYPVVLHLENPGLLLIIYRNLHIMHRWTSQNVGIGAFLSLLIICMTIRGTMLSHPYLLTPLRIDAHVSVSFTNLKTKPR